MFPCANVQTTIVIFGFEFQGEANPNTPTFDGNTSLHLAVGRNQVGMAALLVTAGADPYAENMDEIETGEGEEQHLPAVKEEIEGDGEEMEEQEPRGTTPLDLAVGNKKVCVNLVAFDMNKGRFML